MKKSDSLVVLANAGLMAYCAQFAQSNKDDNGKQKITVVREMKLSKFLDFLGSEQATGDIPNDVKKYLTFPEDLDIEILEKKHAAKAEEMAKRDAAFAGMFD